jgi:CO/xanthine dehydrogenase FAD-binding subunit
VRLLTLSSPALPSDSYAPAVLLAEDYPALIPPGSLVETIAVSAVLVAGKGGDESARRVARHTPAVLDAIAKLAVSQRHPKWRDVNLGAVLPGWSRLDAAEKWLTQAFAQRREVLQDQLDEFLRAGNPVKASHLSVPRRKKLLDDFEAWARKSVSGELDPK